LVIVYRARQKALDREVAIKVLAGEWQGDFGFADRFEAEAKLLAKLNHPNIVTVHDFGESKGLFYIVMEYVDGVNIRDVLRDGKLDAAQALAIVPSICEALQYAHDKGVVHRDIKPENLLLDREGRVRIADFGIAVLAGDQWDRSGTPPYMAPEQKASSPKIDHRADVYALGVVLYEMLTGERPKEVPVPPSKRVQIDVRLDEVVLRALEKEPEQRFQTAAALKTRIETIVNEGSNADTTSASDSPRKTSTLFSHTGLAFDDPFVPVLVGTLIAVVWGSIIDLPNQDYGWFIGRMIVVPLFTGGFNAWLKRNQSSHQQVGRYASIVTIWMIVVAVAMLLSRTDFKTIIPVGSFPAHHVQSAKLEINPLVSNRPGDYQVDLGGGTLFTVIAVTRNPVAESGWWRPDGAPFTPSAEMMETLNQSRSFIVPKGARSPEGECVIYYEFGGEMGVRVTRVREGPARSDVVGRERPGFRLQADGGLRASEERFDVEDPPGEISLLTSAILPEAIGETVAIYDGRKTTEQVGGMVVFSPLRFEPKEKRYRIDVMHNLSRSGYHLRLIAYLKNGEREEIDFHSGLQSGTPTKGYALIHRGELVIDEIQYYALERVPWLSGEVRGIALNARAQE
jgi:hypothetical protein